MMKAIIIGCGDRGRRYAQYSLNHPDEMEIAAIAEPVDAKVQYMKDLHKLQDNQIYSDWREIAEKPKFADFVVISTQDGMHCEPALAFIDKGDGTIRVRLRSRFMTVDKIANRYHGGGHDRASGATCYSLEEMNALIEDCDKAVKEYKENNEGWM